MKLNKISNYTGFKRSNVENYIKAADTDLRSIFLFTQGRIRFGSGTTDTFGENISGEFWVVTTPTATNSEFNVTHNLSAIPVGWIVTSQNGAGDIYTATGSNTTTKAYFRSNVTSTNFTIFLLK